MAPAVPRSLSLPRASGFAASAVGAAKAEAEQKQRRLSAPLFQYLAALLQALATVATALATYSRLFWFSAATQMRPVPTA